MWLPMSFLTQRRTPKAIYRWLYSLPLLACAQSVSAMGLTDQKYTELGGALSNDSQVVQQVDTVLFNNSLRTPYWNVGLLISGSYCTGTWIGKDTSHAYILTAAHCVQGDGTNEFSGEHISFRTANGQLVAAGTSTSYFNNYVAGDFGRCENDIAIAKIPLLTEPVDDQGNAVSPPLLDGAHKDNYDALLGKNTQLAGYGILGSPSLGQVRSVGRRQGEGFFETRTSACLFNRVSESSTNEWAFGSPGDSGSATWQTYENQPVAVSVTSWWMGWQGYTSGHGSIAANADWIKEIAPMAKFYDGNTTPPPEDPEPEPRTLPTITYDTPLEFGPLEEEVRGTVYYLASEGVLDGPTRPIWRYPSGHSSLTVEMIHVDSGESYPVTFRGQRLTHCGWGKMNNIAWCYPSANLGNLKLSFNHHDNPDLPLGQYQGKFAVEALGWHDRTFQQVIEVRADIVIDQPLPFDGTITDSAFFESFPYDSKVAYGSVYYLAPEVSRVKRPRWHGRLNRWTRLKVPVVNELTGETAIVKLRAQRFLGCGWSTMNNAAYCSRDNNRGQLKVTFNPRDNRLLPPGQYTGAFSVIVKGLHDRGFQETLRLKVDITQGSE